MASCSVPPTVSICLPVYMGERYLRQAIESALNQTFSDFELIISDDGSSDLSRAIIREFSESDRRIVVLEHEGQRGLFKNYNRCVEAASGKYIKLFAQDDLLAPPLLELMLPIFEQHPSVALASCAKRWIGVEGEELRIFRTFSGSRLIEGKDVILYNLLNFRNWVGEPSTVIFRRELAGSGFDTDFYHYGDMDYWFRILEDRQYFYLDEILCSFRRHPESESSTNNKGMLFGLDLFRLGHKYADVLRQFGESEEHFCRRALEVIALNIDYQVREDGLDVAQAIAAGLETSLPEGNAQVDELYETLAGFKEVTFQAMRYLSELLCELDHLKRTRADELDLWERQMHALLDSPSWRVTAPLRALKSLMRQAEHTTSRSGRSQRSDQPFQPVQTRRSANEGQSTLGGGLDQ